MEKLHPNDRLKFTLFGKTYRWKLVGGKMTLVRIVMEDSK